MSLVLMCHSSLFFWIFFVTVFFPPFWRLFLGPMSVTGPSKVGTDAANDTVAERRGCAGTGPLQRSVIHDTIKLFNDVAGVVPRQVCFQEKQ